jgi:hypothetical protein
MRNESDPEIEQEYVTAFVCGGSGAPYAEREIPTRTAGNF